MRGKPVGEQRAGDRQGHGWSSAALAPYRLTAGRAPEKADEVVVGRDLGFGPGENVTLRVARGPQAFTVSGTVDGPGYYVTDSRAAQLAGGVRVIGLATERNADIAAVAKGARRAVGDAPAAVLTGAGRREALAPVEDEKTRWIGGQVIAAMAGLAGFVTVFVVASTFAFGVDRRRREFGLLRTIGATPNSSAGCCTARRWLSAPPVPQPACCSEPYSRPASAPY